MIAYAANVALPNFWVHPLKPINQWMIIRGRNKASCMMRTDAHLIHVVIFVYDRLDKRSRQLKKVLSFRNRMRVNPHF